VIFMAISLWTASYINALAESSTIAYHSSGEAARSAHAVHTEYLNGSVSFAVVSALLIYGRRRQKGERSPGLLILESGALAFVGFNDGDVDSDDDGACDARVKATAGLVSGHAFAKQPRTRP